MPHSFTRWHATPEVGPLVHPPADPRAVDPENPLLRFAQRLAERQDRDYKRLGKAARKYRRVMREIPPGYGHRGREFNVSARFLLQAATNPGLKRRLPELADALVRKGSVDAAPGRPDVRLLCGLYGQPLLAFLPSQGRGAAFRASLCAVLEETLRLDHDLTLGIAHPVPHVLPDVGPGHLVPAPGILSEPLQQAFSALQRQHLWANDLLDLALRESASDMPAAALQTLALRRLFTNDWASSWEERQLVDVQGRCWPLDLGAAFPDDPTLLLSLSAMQRFDGLAPLFRIPDDAGPAWDQPLDPALAAKVRSIDTRKLYQTLMLDVISRRRDAAARTTGGAPDAVAQHEAVRRSVDAIRVVRTLIEEDPALSLRRLLERFPHRLDWLDKRPPQRPERPERPKRPHPTHRPDPSKAAQLEHVRPTSPPLAPTPPTPAPRSAPALLGNLELSALLNAASPFNPFKRSDRVLAPLLRDAIGLRLRKDGPKRQRAALRLRNAALDAVKGIVTGLERLPRLDPPRIDADNKRLETLGCLIADTETRYGLPPLTPQDQQPEPQPALHGRSWLPWRRRAQRQT